jgi:hypothetical protein
LESRLDAHRAASPASPSGGNLRRAVDGRLLGRDHEGDGDGDDEEARGVRRTRKTRVSRRRR